MNDYSDYKEQLGDNILSVLNGVALDQKKAEAEVARLEEELGLAKQALRHISENTLPTLMDECGMTEFTTTDGIKISVTETIRASIPIESQAQAFEWLKGHNHDDLIKREFKIEFGKGEEKWAEEFEKKLNEEERPLKVQVKRGVHPQTLASFVREQLKEGVDIPLSVFGASRIRSSKIKLLIQ